jgi:F-type H+-transporting ATPase subunit b
MKHLQLLLMGLAFAAIVVLSVLAVIGLPKIPAHSYHAPLVEVIPNISLFIQMANFLFLLFALNLILFRPIRRKLQERREKMSGYRTDIDRLTAQAEAEGQRLDDLLDAARRSGADKRQTIKQAALDHEKSVVDAATEEMQRAVAVVRNQVKSEVASARTELQGQIEAYSRQVAEKILGRSL